MYLASQLKTLNTLVFEYTRQVDEQRRGVLSTLPHLRQPVCPKSERRMVIRQTVPKKASVEAETSTLI